MTEMGGEDNQRYKKTLWRLIVFLFSSAVFTGLIIMLSDEGERHSITIIALNISAAAATSLGMISIYRHGLKGSHAKSYLFLTLGITLWFCADLNLLYLYFTEGVTEQKQVSVSDIFWLSGYAFLSLHLISVIRTIHVKNISKTITVILIFVIGFVIINLVQSASYKMLINNVERDRIYSELGITNLIITIIYPILDLSLIIPSMVILVNLYREYQHSIPWVLSSLSLLTNAIADNGYVGDFITASPSSWTWDLFYINDFIIMAAALYWFNRFHISDHLKENKAKNG